MSSATSITESDVGDYTYGGGPDGTFCQSAAVTTGRGRTSLPPAAATATSATTRAKYCAKKRMITKQIATYMVATALSEIGTSLAGIHIILLETREIDQGWIVFYNSREYVECGDLSAALAGNGPIFVSGEGELHHLPSAMSWEEAVKKMI